MKLEQTCFNGTNYENRCTFGKCVDNECICDEGFQHNTLFYSIEDCGLPTFMIYLTLSVFYLFFIISFILVIFGYSKQNSNVKKIITYVLISVSAISIQIPISVIYGTIPIFWFLNATTIVFISLAYTQFITGFFQITSKNLKTNVTESKIFKNTIILLNLTLCLPFFIVAVYISSLGDYDSDDYDIVAFNSSVAFGYSMFPLHIFVAIPLVNYTCNKILNNFKNVRANLNSDQSKVNVSETEKSVNEALKRIEFFKKAFTIIALLEIPVI